MYYKLLQNDIRRSKDLEFRSLFETDGVKREYLDRLKYLEEDNNSDQARYQYTSQMPDTSYSNMISKHLKPLGRKSQRVDAHTSVHTPSAVLDFTNEHSLMNSKIDKNLSKDYTNNFPK